MESIWTAQDLKVGLVCYIKENATAQATQDAVIGDFRKIWADRLKGWNIKENPSLFPGDDRHGGTCDSREIVTDDIRKEIIHGEKFVFVAGAVRFQGQHGRTRSTRVKMVRNSSVRDGGIAWNGRMA